MLEGINRLANLAHSSAPVPDAHFASVEQDGHTITLARTIGVPLRYFVAKMYHGPFLVVAHRIDELYAWCRDERIEWQFDPAYTRMVPAHYRVTLQQVGCPDPAPAYDRFFTPAVGKGSSNLAEAGAAYGRAAYAAVRRWLEQVPAHDDIAVAFSGGVDSTAVLLFARQALSDMGSDPSRLRPCTLDLGGGRDATQAIAVARELGVEATLEIIPGAVGQTDYERAIEVIEDYHPLDVECAAAALSLLQGVRQRHASIRYLLDGDGGDENLKSYPLEDSDLTLSSVLRNPLLYHEGWGVDALKHSVTYSGGLSRGYVRSYAPAAASGLVACSPLTARPVIDAALSIPFEDVVGGSVERLYALKHEVTAAGVRQVTGRTLPMNPKRRFQDGAGGVMAGQRLSRAWCRAHFARVWRERQAQAGSADVRGRSGNEMTLAG